VGVVRRVVARIRRLMKVLIKIEWEEEVNFKNKISIFTRDFFFAPPSFSRLLHFLHDFVNTLLRVRSTTLNVSNRSKINLACQPTCFFSPPSYLLMVHTLIHLQILDYHHLPCLVQKLAQRKSFVGHQCSMLADCHYLTSFQQSDWQCHQSKGTH